MKPPSRHKSPFLAPRRASYEMVAGGEINAPHHENGQGAVIFHYSLTASPFVMSGLTSIVAHFLPLAIVGAGIIGIPYAMKETGLVSGLMLIILSGALGCKSLRLLVETAKHVDAPSYEVLSEAAFGRVGWAIHCPEYWVTAQKMSQVNG
eukprot:scaffold2852_cov189-Alexandrium_tamarense.AAC.16